MALPVSDGGPGLIEALAAARGGEIRTVQVPDPLGRTVPARVLLLELEGSPTTLVETADACGMHLLDESELDPMRLGTGGVGALIEAAAALAHTVVVGLGGSATVDGGAGMAAALGWRLLDEQDRALVSGGASLSGLARILAPESGRWAVSSRSSRDHPRVIALADVRNPLTGPRGAAAVFGPQKGASPTDVRALDAGLVRLADVLRHDLGVHVASIEGGGAAGGLGAACVAFLGAELERGADFVLRAVDFDRHLATASLVVTGEGGWDAQSSMGKVTGEVISRAGRAGVPVLLVAGSVVGEVPDHVTVARGEGAVLDLDAIRTLVGRELMRAEP